MISFTNLEEVQETPQYCLNSFLFEVTILLCFGCQE